MIWSVFADNVAGWAAAGGWVGGIGAFTASATAIYLAWKGDRIQLRVTVGIRPWILASHAAEVPHVVAEVVGTGSRPAVLSMAGCRLPNHDELTVPNDLRGVLPLPTLRDGEIYRVLIPTLTLAEKLRERNSPGRLELRFFFRDSRGSRFANGFWFDPGEWQRPPRRNLRPK